MQRQSDYMTGLPEQAKHLRDIVCNGGLADLWREEGRPGRPLQRAGLACSGLRPAGPSDSAARNCASAI